MNVLTEQNLFTIDTDTLAASLLDTAIQEGTGARIGATHALTSYNGGACLGHRAVRRHILVDDDGRPYMKWYQLTKALRDPNDALARLNATAYDTVELACALASEHRVNLYGPTGRWGRVNRHYMIQAFAMACGAPALRDDARTRLAQKLGPGEPWDKLTVEQQRTLLDRADDILDAITVSPERPR